GPMSRARSGPAREEPSMADAGTPDQPHDATAVAIDPVCGMRVKVESSKHRFAHAGQTFHFCCARCRDKFAADPAAYLAPKAAPEPPPPTGATYTCPMHPEVHQQGPGSCPICGMALEPETITAEAPPNQ